MIVDGCFLQMSAVSGRQNVSSPWDPISPGSSRRSSEAGARMSPVMTHHLSKLHKKALAAGTTSSLAQVGHHAFKEIYNFNSLKNSLTWPSKMCIYIIKQFILLLVFFLFQLGHSDLSQSQSTWVNFLTMVIIISFWSQSQSNLKQFEAVAQ